MPRRTSTPASSAEFKVTRRHDWRWEHGWTVTENEHPPSVYPKPWENVDGALRALMVVAVGRC